MAAVCGLSGVLIALPDPAGAQEPNPTTMGPASAQPAASQQEPGAAAQEPEASPEEREAPPETRQPVQQKQGMYIYKVRVVQRDLDAVNYLHRSGPTTIGFLGTPLLPKAKGEAKVESGRGGITIHAKFEGLTPANGFGREYLTYVLWAISPDGRAQNLGEVLPAGTKNEITVTTAFQSFGMIVTAEPYFSVTEPSDVVVLENVIEPNKTNGVLEKVKAHYSLLPRGAYAETGGAHSVTRPITRDERSPLELYEADNALRIAQLSDADKYAPDIWAEAKKDLDNATALDSQKHGDRKMEITDAREAVERAEDARIASLRKQAEEKAQADAAAKQQAQVQAQQAQLDAERAQAAKAQADAERARAEAQAADARANAAQANKSAEDANAVREKLKAQLNSVLQTSETARGLIVNMNDVLFNTGSATLKPDAQVRLAKVAGILLAYPGLRVQVEGFTDSVGSDEMNQKLSENRAEAVKQFLVAQGVSEDNVTAKGFGKNNPVADNSTASGRAQNRRVNMVVSGDAIGVTGTTASVAQ